MALLQELFGRGNQRGGGGGMPMQMAELGALTYRTVKGQGSLADMMGFVDGTPQTTQSSMGVQADTGGGMFSGLPHIWVATIAFVCGPIRRSTSAISSMKLWSEISANTGVTPAFISAIAVAAQVST